MWHLKGSVNMNWGFRTSPDVWTGAITHMHLSEVIPGPPQNFPARMLMQFSVQPLEGRAWLCLAHQDCFQIKDTLILVYTSNCRSACLIERITFVFLGWGNACELGVDLIILGDLQHGGAVLDHPRQKVRSPRNLEDVLNVRQVICTESVVNGLCSKEETTNPETEISPWASLSFFSR